MTPEGADRAGLILSVSALIGATLIGVAAVLFGISGLV